MNQNYKTASNDMLYGVRSDGNNSGQSAVKT